jgi:hypothetical protein
LGIRPGAFSFEGGGKIMAVRKIILILWVLAAALGLFLAIHFSGHALQLLDRCLASALRL